MLVESKAPPASGDSAGSALEQIPGFLHVTRRRELESLNACILTCFHTSIITIAKFLVFFFTMCRRTVALFKEKEKSSTPCFLVPHQTTSSIEVRQTFQVHDIRINLLFSLYTIFPTLDNMHSNVG